MESSNKLGYAINDDVRLSLIEIAHETVKSVTELAQIRGQTFLSTFRLNFFSHFSIRRLS